MADFSSSIRESGGVSIINLKGFLDAHTAPTLENNFTQLINENKFKIVVNFEELSYISSAGLGVFMAFIENVRDNNGDIKLTNMSDKVFNIFDLLGFPLLYEIYKNEQEAIKKFFGS
ncbi:MAG: STAS domain-containing protein [Ignavibacteriota bacterium]|jgi:anti-sigma B factor antagonist|nr:MAG: anti-sigma factor antagonist [Chlorobiota bacterium]MBE7477199.1 STAS domain-containing protein [Ignavibacteriales bacterium]MBL1122583.1 anti-sigma factor antagonist [Ignavibacteriota bacterium]MBV6419043.1 Anti-sigma-B factor antagonist [Ignavibacteriaceae bacterium]MCE7856714.1 anti-sigma factor antagonist [Ignavibacteria bacterium CHB3]MEB2296066.1 STAS domain-containing protein [Ignavibacteria bacterium]